MTDTHALRAALATALWGAGALSGAQPACPGLPTAGSDTLPAVR
jgi:hypothetical protein